MCRSLYAEAVILQQFDFLIRHNNGDMIWSFLRRRTVVMMIFSVLNMVTIFTNKTTSAATNVGGAVGTQFVAVLGVVCFLVSTAGLMSVVKSRRSSRLPFALRALLVLLSLSTIFYIARLVISVVNATRETPSTVTEAISVAVSPFIGLLSLAVFAGVLAIVYKLEAHIRLHGASDLEQGLDVHNPTHTVAYSATPIPVFATATHVPAHLDGSDLPSIKIVDAIPVHSS